MEAFMFLLLPVLILIVAFWAIAKIYTVSVPKDKALVKQTFKGIEVFLSGKTKVFPIIHKQEYINLLPQTLEIQCKNEHGVFTKDPIKIDLSSRFVLAVKRNQEAIKNIFERIGAEKATDNIVLEQIFTADFLEAVKSSVKSFDFDTLVKNPTVLETSIAEKLTHIEDYELQVIQIDKLDYTAISFLDKDNILDGESIKNIVERTAKAEILIAQKAREKLEQEKQKIHAQNEAMLAAAIAEAQRFAEEQEKQKQAEIEKAIEGAL